jgi:hypothetical protein
MVYGSEGGENVSFKHKKTSFVLKLYIYNVFSLQRPFVEFLISHA